MQVANAIRAQMGGLGRCAMTGMLIGLMATPTFALGAPAATGNPDDQQKAGVSLTTATTLETTSEAPDSLPLIATDDNATDVNALPEAPAAPESTSLVMPVKDDLLADGAGSNASSTSTSSTQKHKVRPGFLALGIVGAAAAGFGAYIFSIKTTNTGTKDALGTLFLAPGAAAAGLGFYFAFK